MAFQCAVILAGSSFNFTLHLGAMAALRDSDVHPDVIIASCGGSLASAIINKFPDTPLQKKYIQSDEFYNLFHLATLQYHFIHSLLWRLSKMHIQYLLSRFFSRTPDFLEKTLYHLPEKLNLTLFDQSFPTSFPRFILTAGKLTQEHPRFLQEIFFTDQETAKLLKNFSSPVALQFPHSFVKKETEVFTDWKFSESARAAISDPFLLNPLIKQETVYMSGSIDLYPLELALRLSPKIIMPYSPLFRTIDQIVLRHFYGYDNIERYRFITSQSKTVERWIDVSDYQDFMKIYGFDPKPCYAQGRVKNSIPHNKKEFFKKTQAQWNYGWERAKEALSMPPYSQNHIRKPFVSKTLSS